MQYIGLDVHKRETQVCILSDTSDVVEETRIHTTPERLGAVVGARPRARILLEAATESEWVARCLEAAGHEVIVADPNYVMMYATRTRAIKTDRRDARALADACRLGLYRPAHRLSPAQRRVRNELVIREGFVRTRARYISSVRALLRYEGLRVGSGMARTFVQRVNQVAMPEPLAREIAPVLVLLDHLNVAIAAADAHIKDVMRGDPLVRRLCTVPGVGAVIAASFVATVDDVHRFPTAHHLEAYLGLVPREHSSGEKQRRGRITKAGNTRLRALLVEAATVLLRGSRHGNAGPLRTWALRVAARGGMKGARVALARRLAGILYAMWRDGTVFGEKPSVAPLPRLAALVPTAAAA